MVRPFWKEQQFHADRLSDVTALMVQSETYDITRLCVDSFLTHYPDVRFVIVNNSPSDISGDWLRYKAAHHPNITLWDREGLNSHGESMDEAIHRYITSKYFLTLDSDIISVRGGWLEQMIMQIERQKLYATGSLMLVTRHNDACGAPYDESDILRYAHPSCSLHVTQMYHQLRPFANHGAPGCYNFQDAEIKEFKVGFFPIDKYVAHLSGASYTDPKTVWPDDLGTFSRPMITFITTQPDHIEQLNVQNDHDFDVVTLGVHRQDHVIIHDGQPGRKIDNQTYDIRFRVQGDYICELMGSISPGFVKECRRVLTEGGSSVEGQELVERKKWQYL